MKFRRYKHSLRNWESQANSLHWMRCTPKKTIETVVESNNDLLVQLKRNQPSLHDAMVKHTVNQCPDETNRMYDQRKRNRIETRDASTWTLPVKSAIEPSHGHFKTLICIHRVVKRFDTRKKDWQTTQETAYYLCTRKINAKEANKVVRITGALRIEYTMFVIREWMRMQVE